MPGKPDSTPKELWIELTSKCPFSCVFCSRELLRGAGRHMDFAIYRRLIEQLDSPEIIRLNYSGESAHYPRLAEAVELAKSTGARVELVSAVSSMKPRLVEALVRSGLDRLTVSVHTLQEQQYKDIYGFGSVHALRERLHAFQDAKRRIGVNTPSLDFAFVAMARNIDQMEPVLELAQAFAVPSLDIHPVIRRDPIPETFAEELDDGNRLRGDFLERLDNEVKRLEPRFPGITLCYSTPEPGPSEPLDHQPRYWPHPLPAGALIDDCDQNPWSTTHILANGDVVTCEVRDRQPLGNLQQSSLGEIWHGPAYERFREDYVCGLDPKCHGCAYKKAWIPKPETVTSRVRMRWNRSADWIRERGKNGIAMTAAVGVAGMLHTAELAGRLARPVAPRPKRPAAMPAESDGVSVIVPERDSPAMLGACLESLSQALRLLAAPWQVCIVCNGSQADRYRALRARFPEFVWRFHEQPMGFAEAITDGLEEASKNWVFLLNSDMLLEPSALAALWNRRSREVFSIAAQIHLQDPARRREETGLTAMDASQGLKGLYDRAQFTTRACASHLYSGGGASLFQRRLLERFVGSGNAYAPFYWEDVDWGLRAQRLGYDNLFAPDAVAHHRHRATVSRFYSPGQIERMFECNALVNGLAHSWYRPPMRLLSMLLAKHRREIFDAPRLAHMARQRFESAARPGRVRNFHDDVIRLFPREREAELPWMVLVSPYSLVPRHGSTRRIEALARELSNHYRIAVVADEGWRFEDGHLDTLSFVDALWMVRTPRPETGKSRRERMRSHARDALRDSLLDALRRFRPEVVQIEHEELAPLIELKTTGRWFITLHDVHHGTDAVADNYVNRRLRAFDGVIVCSHEDANLLDVQPALIENGADTDKLQHLQPSAGASILFIGPLSYRPNREGLSHFIEHCLPLILAEVPEVILRVLGGPEGLHWAGKGPFDRAGVEFLDYMPDISEPLSRATLTINPLRGIRGSCVKIIESLSAGRVCVSTREGARGWLGHELPGLITVDTTSDFADTVVRLLKAPDERHELESRMPEAVRRFDWSHRAREQLELYRA